MPSKRKQITSENVFETLIGACYLEILDLVQYCETHILKLMTESTNIINFIAKIDSLLGYQNIPDLIVKSSKNVQILKKIYGQLKECCFSAILYVFSLSSLDDYSYEEDPSNNVAPSSTVTIPGCLFLSRLSLKWLELVLASDALAVPSEFDRYLLTKRIFKLRSTYPNLIPLERQIIEYTMDACQDKPSIEPRLVYLKEKKDYSLFSLIDNVLGNKKRKIQDELDSVEINLEIEKPNTRVIKALPRKFSKATGCPLTLPATLTRIYEEGIVYTYMTFQQLG